MTTQFNLDDDVRLIAVDLPGKVNAVMQESGGISYRVRYWAEGKRQVAWVDPDEIKLEHEHASPSFGLANRNSTP